MAAPRHLPLPLLLPLLLAATCTAAPNAQSGAYVVQLRYVDSCGDDGSLVDFDLDVEESDGRSILAGTFTVSERLEAITGTINCSIRGDAGWRENAVQYRIRDWCQEGVIRRILEATNLTLEEECAVPPGTYAVLGLDLDEPVHAAAGDSAPLGLYRTRLALEAGRGAALCSAAELEFASPDE
ncbi:uncharacterized protein LOC126272813 [Schistocerca gregaria]|uniref:uncharacterized protein LOC126272813 n=1 Tax=Schistocerca gregaria TaxID=7010 RepID=UPI00211DEED7|nr:uncharacterized protein LOC126272813 [Schistocerca gregaria]